MFDFASTEVWIRSPLSCATSLARTCAAENRAMKSFNCAIFFHATALPASTARPI